MCQNKLVSESGNRNPRASQLSQSLALKEFLTVIAFSGAILGAFFLNSTLQRPLREAPSRAVVSAEGGARWNPALFRLATFGHLATALDWVWLGAMVDDRITHVPHGTHARVYYDFALIAELDPAFSDVYRAGANFLAVIRDDNEGARELLLRGDAFRLRELAHYPEDFKQRYWFKSWQIPVNLAYVELFELQDLPQAAEAFREAAAVPDSPPYLTRLALQLQSPGGEYEVGLRLLTLMRSGATDSATRDALDEKLHSLQVAQFLDEANRDYLKFLSGLSASPTPAMLARFLSQRPRPGGISGAFDDPFGGRLSLDPTGRIITSTPHVRVFGLD